MSPCFLDDVEKLLFEVIKDNKIDSSDLPQLILLVQKLYETIYSNKDIKIDKKNIPVECSNILKFICHFFIIERMSRTSENDSRVLLELIYKLIDSCIGLLSFPKNIKVKGCLSFLFGK